MDRWKRQRNVLGVLGVHVDDLVGGGNLVLQNKLCNGFGLNLNLEPGNKVDFDSRCRELCQEYTRKSIMISMSKFAQEMEPVTVPKHVKDDLDAPLESTVHTQFRGCVGQLQWCSCKEIHSCRLPLESCKAGLRLPTVMISSASTS